MKQGKTKQAIDRAYNDGYVEGIITARYYWLRYSSDDENIRLASAGETPEVVQQLLSNLCTDCRAKQMFEEGWGSLDALLLCETTEELHERMKHQFGNALH